MGRMTRANQLTTKVSTKGQVVLPKAIRAKRQWNAQARDLVEQGFDFADALHLTAAADCETFAAFDQKLPSVPGRLASAR